MSMRGLLIFTEAFPCTVFLSPTFGFMWSKRFSTSGAEINNRMLLIVKHGMLFCGQNFQVIKSIIKAITVLMMNKLSAK